MVIHGVATSHNDPLRPSHNHGSQVVESIRKDTCKVEERKRSEALPKHCRCNDSNITKPQHVEQCFNKHLCEEKCDDSLTSMAYCETKDRVNCELQCAGDGPGYNSAADQQQCTVENAQTIKDQLYDRCIGRISTFSDDHKSGAELVCEGGCEQLCRNLANSGRINEFLNNRCGTSITEAKAFAQCRDNAFNTQIATNLPRHPNNLPPKFTWRNQNEKCKEGDECDHAMQMAFDETLTECKNLKQKAVLCCKDPIKCVEGGDKKTRLFTDVGPVNGGISTQCLLLKQKFSNASNLGNQMASQCRNSASSCVRVCKQKMESDFLSLFAYYCAFDLRVASEYKAEEHTCSEKLIGKYSGLYRQKLSSIPKQCEGEGYKSHQMAQNAAEILKSALSAAKCEEQASGGITSSGGTTGSDSGTQSSTGSPGSQSSSGGDSSIWSPMGGPQAPGVHVGGGDDSSSGKSIQEPNTDGGGGGGGDDPSSSRSLSSADSFGKGTDKNFREAGSGSAGKSGTGAVYGGGAVGGGAHLKGSQAALGKKIGKAGKKAGGKEAGKEGKDKEALRNFAKVGKNSGKDSYSFWKKLPPRETPNNRISSFGSPHDNIFKRISDRFDLMCRTEQIPCTD